MSDTELLKRITINPAVLGGKPTVRGLRISVEQILRWLAGGMSQAQVLREFPKLEKDDIRAALIYGAGIASLTRMTGEDVGRVMEHGDSAPG